MKTTLFNRISGALVAAVVLSFAVPYQAHAGPGPHTFAPITTIQAADALKPGQQVAIQCPDCGAIQILTLDKNRSALKSWTCPVCHEVFHTVESGSSGKTHVTGKFAMVCASGKHARVAAMQ
jgi:predicted RNA-binding Zn-ribbon protein involved in translation (DUF1610 family)